MTRQPPLESRALAQMRQARGWKKNRLAKALGMRPDSLYDYENGKMTPSRELLERAAAEMGYSAAMVDRTLSYLRLADADLALGPAGGPAHREIRQAAADMGLLWEEFAVSMAQRVEIRLDALMERRRAPELWERLKRYSSAQRRAIYQEEKDARSWGLVELLCQKSLDAAPDSAARALELAEEALFLARLVPVPEPFRWRLEGLAGVHVGNANRVGGQLPAAGTAFDQALDRWQDGAPGDPEGLLDEARVLGLEASLRREQRRLPEALDLLERAVAADRSGEVRYLLINKAKTLEEMGRNEEAITALQQALPRIDIEREPRLLWDLRQNLLVKLCRLGRHAEAERHLEDLREEAIRLGHRLHLVRVVWLQGTIAAGLNRPEEAEAAFEQVRKELLARGIAYDAALVSLELAVLYLKEGRTAEVQELARQLAPVFQAQGVSRETLASIKLFCEAVEKETITWELAQHVLEDLRRSGLNSPSPGRRGGRWERGVGE